MMTESNDVSRRNFLRTLAVASGAALSLPLMPMASNAADFTNTMTGTGKSRKWKVGVMLDAESAASESLLTGMHHAFERAGAIGPEGSIDLIIEDIGSETRRIAPKAKKLMDRDSADVVLAHVNSHTSSRLSRALEAERTVFIEMNAGEIVPNTKSAHPYLFRSTLNLWQAYVALGAWAASIYGKRGAICASFFNSGFGFHSAFSYGFESAGGEIVAIKVTDAPSGVSGTLDEIWDSLRMSNLDVLFASFSSHEARHFSQLFRGSGLTVPLVGTNFRDEVNRIGIGESWTREHVHASSWSADLGGNNVAFMSEYREKIGKDPDAYSVLGYDTANLLLEALKAVHPSSGTNALRHALSSVRSTSPRGELVMDHTTQSVVSPLYRIAGGANSDMVELLEAPSDLAVQLQNHHSTSHTGGWLNTYEFA